MVANFVAGGAAINVLARRAGARLLVVDAGVATPVSGVRSLRFGSGTANIAAGPAMSEETAAEAVLAGAAIVAELGAGLIGIGEMGIGNTTSASALCAAFLDGDAEAVTGTGTGPRRRGRRSARSPSSGGRWRPTPDREPLAVLAALGGFEIAVLTGVVLGCAAQRVPVVLDGFITGAAALAPPGWRRRRRAR